jgi:hypothetical protein
MSAVGPQSGPPEIPSGIRVDALHSLDGPQNALRPDAPTRGTQAGGITMEGMEFESFDDMEGIEFDSFDDAPPGDAYWTEAIDAVDQGLFTLDSSPDAELVRFELEKALSQPHLDLGCSRAA